jgi:hypothetical protein
MSTPPPFELPPDPARLVEGLRDTGYQVNTAIADIIDNSIAADASHVWVEFKPRYDGSLALRIWDDGTGMEPDVLVNAMRYGAPARPSRASLGKFGLGLKTASTAFCRRLTVISRPAAEAALRFAMWDLDDIHQANRWVLPHGAANSQNATEFNRFLNGKRGTLILWDKVDRVLKDPTIAGSQVNAKRAMDKIEGSLREHLGMVFQRFLDASDNRARNLTIHLNDTPVVAWDPFCTAVSKMEKREEFEVEIPGGEVGLFVVRAFILPRKEEFPSEETWRISALKNKNQGIYIYRENRMIHGPDWLDLFAKEPHMTLLRVEFSFDHKLDEYFQVDIKKSQIILDTAIAAAIDDFLTPLRRIAEDRFRKGQRRELAKSGVGAHDPSNRTIRSKVDELRTPNVKDSDSSTNTATISNASGEVRLKIKVSSSQRPEEVFVQTAEELQDGMLWEPALVDGKPSVRINRGHPYYSKVYIPNLSSGVTVQGMDSLMWAITNAELNCVSESTKRSFEDLRFEVSRTLRRLVEDLPEPKANE